MVCKEGATRGATSAADPRIVAGGVYREAESPIRKGSIAMQYSHTKWASCSQCPAPACVGSVTPEMLTAGTEPWKEVSGYANSPHDAHECRSVDNAQHVG